MAYAVLDNRVQNGSVEVDLEREVRFLTPSHRDSICSVLGINQDTWKIFMTKITKSRDDLTPKYTMEDISIIDSAAPDPKGKVDILLDEWGTSGRKRPRILDLVRVLTSDELLARALHTVVTEILGLESVEDIPGILDNYDSLTMEMNGYSLNWHPEATAHQPSTTVSTHISEEAYESNFDQSGPTSIGDVPRLNYSFLQEITAHFSDIPMAEGGMKLGQGSFGTVYYGVMKGTLNINGPVAVKRLHSTSDRRESRFETEIECMRFAMHENILQLLAYSNDGSELCLVYEYIENGNLADALKLISRSTPLTSIQRLGVAIGTAKGLSYLHNHSREKSLVHRDVKSENILLDKELKPKLSDFGLVRLTGGGDFNTSVDHTSFFMGTPLYTAPEAIAGMVSYKGDVYSYGLVLLEMLTSVPAKGNSKTDQMSLLMYWQDLEDKALLIDPVFTSPGSSISSRDWVELANQCLDYDRKKRPEMETVIERLNSLSSISFC